MKDKNIAKIYAKALLVLGKEKNVAVVDEMINLTKVINSSNELENLLFLDVFTSDERKDVLNKLAPKINLNPLVLNMLHYLIEEKRMGVLPLIVKEMVVIDDELKGFLRGTIEGSAETIDQSIVDQMKEYLVKKLGKSPELEYKQNTNITAGYKVTVEDLQLDASLDAQFSKFKQSVVIE